MTPQPLARSPRGLRGFSGDVAAKLHAARLWIMTQRPYYSRALFACPLIPADDRPTMAISMDRKWRIYVNEGFVESRSVEQTAAVLIHELNHALRGHAERGRHTAAPEHRVIWNVACDLEINDDLEDDCLDIEDMILPDTFDLEPGECAEVYYRQLLDAAVSLEQVPCCGSVCIAHPADHDQLDGDGEAGLGELQRRAILRATAKLVIEYSTADGDGHHYGWDAPAGLLDWAEQVAGPQGDWRQLLARALQQSVYHQTGASDYSWQRPPRRCDGDDPVLRPALTAQTGHVGVVLDTSGSMGTDDHAQAFCEIDAILTKAVPGTPITVLSCDHDTQLVQRVTQARNITPVGGGGTDMAAGIKTAAAANPAAIVVITDGFTPWPETPPPGARTVIAALTNSDWAQRVPAWIQAIDITPTPQPRT